MNCLRSNWSRTIRSPIAVSASACVFIFIEGTEGFIVLDGIEDMTERLKVVDYLRGRLGDTESYVRYLIAKLGKPPNGADTGSFLNAHTTLGDLDSGAVGGL